ncbi:E3 ubiquitin-protein ligase RMA3-like [Lycium ferocissimum]|uniref:E3 ubiquitin-protein ligase RMA3-like n=1 Tax=Lycium ferocissimum TaxID=112874 RepID=UPI002815ED98|nr:E3 ubiquitin-protein ligase RMA3-like [Lycium ferocissimum]
MVITRVGPDDDVSVKKQNSVPFPTTTSDNVASCFDCNICLDSAHDPVVTLCGHLYCWPCIYKWFQVESSGPAGSSKCPVCKARISNSSLVPLYGRGISSLESEPKKSQEDVEIPHRPRAIGTTTPRNSPSPISHLHQRLRPTFQHHRQYIPQAFGSFAAMAPSSFGEMISARMFGSTGTRVIAYPHPSSYVIRGSGGGPRMGREEMQVDKFLNRLSIFLFCCFILCLLLF